MPDLGAADGASRLLRRGAHLVITVRVRARDRVRVGARVRVRLVCTSPSRQRFSERRTASAARRRGGSAPTAWLGLGFRVRFRV